MTSEVEGLTTEINLLTSQLTELTGQVAAEEERLTELATREDRGQKGQLAGQNRSTLPVKTDPLEQDRIGLRRAEVLTLKGQGLTNQDIAGQLEVSMSTVKNDLKALNGQVAKVR